MSIVVKPIIGLTAHGVLAQLVSVYKERKQQHIHESLSHLKAKSIAIADIKEKLSVLKSVALELNQVGLGQSFTVSSSNESVVSAITSDSEKLCAGCFEISVLRLAPMLQQSFEAMYEDSYSSTSLGSAEMLNDYHHFSDQDFSGCGIVFEVSDVQYERAGNIIGDVIDGLVLHIKALSKSHEMITVRVEKNIVPTNHVVHEKITAFVMAFNALQALLSRLNEKVFQNDDIINLIKSELQQAVTGIVPGSTFHHLSQIGVYVAPTAKCANDAEEFCVSSSMLLLDDQKLSHAVQKDFDAVLDVFTDEKAGVVTKLSNLISALIEPSGLLDLKLDEIQAATIRKARQLKDNTVCFSEYKKRRLK